MLPLPHFVPTQPCARFTRARTHSNMLTNVWRTRADMHTYTRSAHFVRRMVSLSFFLLFTLLALVFRFLRCFVALFVFF